MDFAMTHSMEKITDPNFHKDNVFCLCFGNRIHQSMLHFPDPFWRDLIIPYYHSILIKFAISGKHSVKK